MKRKILIIIFMSGLLIIIAYLANNYAKNQERVCFKNDCFEVELALTPAERSRGLMFKENLDKDQGMLFVFENEGRHSFWMKNTLIPLDIIWIDKKGKVVFVSENTLPCRDSFCPAIKPDKDAKYVLEIGGGIAKKIGLGLGENLRIKYNNIIVE